MSTESEPVTVFWPYPEGVTAEDDIAVVRFPGLTRDYTIECRGSVAKSGVGASARNL